MLGFSWEKQRSFVVACDLGAVTISFACADYILWQTGERVR